MSSTSNVQNTLSPEDSHKQLARRIGSPLRLTVELTTSCQLSCEHCYNFDRSIQNSPTSLSFETIIRILAEAESLGVLRLELTGGESTLHPRIKDIIQEAKSRHFWVTLKTHGALSERRAREVLDAGVDQLSISLYGDEKVHDAFTGVRGSWSKTRRTIELAVKQSVQVNVSLVLHSRNHTSITSLQEEIYNLGAETTIGTTIHPRHVDGDVDESVRLNRDDWVEFYRNLYRGEAPTTDMRFSEKPRNFQCACAVESFAVASDGSVYPCIGVPWVAGSIYNESLTKIWNDASVFWEIRKLRSEDFKHCQGCQLKNYCERIAPSAYLASGEYTGYDPSQCEQAEAHRAYAAEFTSKP